MAKWIKLIIGIVLLPFCLGELLAVFRVMEATGAADTVWVAFGAGAACWVVIFLMLPKPIWIYVLGHEATHAIWTWMFGGKVKRFKVSSKGGHVITDKTNFVIALAPYFFPFYAVILITLFALGNAIFGLRPYFVWFHLLLGGAYCFHVTLTCYILKTRQSDVTSQGYIFSLAIIALGNFSVLLFGIPLLTQRVGILQATAWWLHETGRIFSWFSHAI
jgi:hypothetical protein